MGRQSLCAFLNASLDSANPSRAFFAGVAVTVAVQVALQLAADGFFVKRLMHAVFRIVRKVLRPVVQQKIKEAGDGIRFLHDPALPVYEALPEAGLGGDEVLQLATTLHSKLDCRYDTGELSGTVYHGGDEHTTLMNRVMEVYQWSNPLHMDTFNAVRKMEAEVVAMCVRMYNGHNTREDACGAITSGGTESIMMAMLTYRQQARERGIANPTIVMPVTAHPAFDKAGHYYGMRVVKVPVDSVSGRVDPAELERYITSDTVVIVGSTPNFPYGAVDPIQALAAIAVRHGVGMHVDSCLGGFLVPFLERAGVPGAPVADFRVPGVTTISCDTHKFGYAPKGTSVVLFASRDQRQRMFFAMAEWPGGLYASPTTCGSRAGNVVAATWAAMLVHGVDGYTKAARAVYDTMAAITEGIRTTPGLYMLGEPSVCAIAFTSDTLDIFAVDKVLRSKGWKLNPLQFPSGIQFSLTLVHTREGIAERFIKELREAVVIIEKERRDMEARGAKMAIGNQSATLYGSQQQVPDRTIIEDVARVFLDKFYDTRDRDAAPAA